MFRKNKKQSTSQSSRRVVTGQPRNAAVFSYHANRSNRRTENVGRGQPQTAEGDSTKQRAKSLSRRSWKQRSITTVIITAGLGVLVSVSIVSPQPHIMVLGDQKQQVFLQKSDVYRTAAQRIIASSPLSRNKLTFDADDISKQMREQFPELAAVTVTLPVIGWEPVVHVQAFTPSVVLIGDGTDDFVLDSEGRAFAPDSLRATLDKLHIPVVRDQSGLDINEGQRALPSSQVAYIAEVYSQLQAKKLKVVGMTLPAGRGELEVRLDKAPYLIRFNLYGDAREGAGRYLAAKTYLESHGETPKEYIDVRVNNRVYFR